MQQNPEQPEEFDATAAEEAAILAAQARAAKLLPLPQDLIPSAKAGGPDVPLSSADEIPRPRLGPLDRPPDRSYAQAAFTLYLGCLVTSLAYWRSDLGAWLWVSGAAVFQKHEYWRLVTALFTHSDLGHWMANGPLFLIFGWYLRAYFGRLAFPWLPLVLGVLTNLSTLAYYPPDTRLIGASGMAYAMAALWICFYVRFDVHHRLGMRIFRALGFSMIVLFPTTFEPHTSYLAHAFGFLWGMVGALCLLPWQAKRFRQQTP